MAKTCSTQNCFQTVYDESRLCDMCLSGKTPDKRGIKYPRDAIYRSYDARSAREAKLRTLPRWAKAFLAARIARRAIETLDARKVGSDFTRVLDTLQTVESAVDNGVEFHWSKRGFSAARQYADARAGGAKTKSADVFAALAVDDAFALVTDEARQGRRPRLPPDDFQVSKLEFARASALQTTVDERVSEALEVAFQSDLERVVTAVRSGTGWNDSCPVPKDFLAQHCEFDSSLDLDGSSIVEMGPAIGDEVIARIRENPTLLYQLPPRAFEELIARVFEGFGFQVELTAQVRDGGRDIIAVSHAPAKLKYLIECKKYARENKVGLEIVQRLHGVVMGEPATAGILATTSAFTGPARDFLERPTVEYRLSGRDFEGLKSWLADWERTQRIRAVIGSGFTLTESGLVVPG